MNPSTYEEGIKELARLYVEGDAGYDNSIRSAQTIAERFNRDPSWSSVDFEDAVTEVRKS